MISVERLSLRDATIGIALVSGLVAVALLGFSAYMFKSAAFDSQQKSVARVIEVASLEVLSQLDQRVFAVGTSLQARPEFRAGLERKLASGEDAGLLAALHEPFVNGYVGAGQLDLVKLRAYDLDLVPLAQNASAVELPPGLPPVLRQRAAGRTGADRLKAVSALWLSPRGPLYSVLLPVGGLQVKGYLEAVVDPAYNLGAVAQMTRMPVSVFGMDGRLLHQSAAPAETKDADLPVTYVLPAADGQSAFRLVGLDDVTQLRAEVWRTTAMLLAGIVLLGGLAAMAAVVFLNRFLFLPLRGMQADMERCAGGDLSATVNRRMVREFRVLADAFNLMAQQLAARIEELRLLSCRDSLTSLSNRHHFDVALALEWARVRRTGNWLSLLIIDIDHFKLYNDHYGHLGGDECLRAVGRVLAGVARRPTDIAARYGGEEFAILLPDTAADGAYGIAEAIQGEMARLRLPHAASPTSQRVTVCIGIASCSAAQCDSAQLVAAADEALYRAKHRGRNRIAVAENEG
ncbi:MAG: diguanylate cyclase [Gammaproteobacteria bacterium]|nr:diguanylate cyclase [Gammaproteobacteria bacterium]MBU1972471.1 diguanylate cyclase [Gammaproteobacteria bacterium]